MNYDKVPYLRLGGKKEKDMFLNLLDWDIDKLCGCPVWHKSISTAKKARFNAFFQNKNLKSKIISNLWLSQSWVEQITS